MSDDRMALYDPPRPLLSEGDRARLAQIRARLAGISPGEWRTGEPARPCYVETDRANICVVCDGGTQGDEFWRNRDLIANAPADIRFLLELVGRLR